MSDTRQEVGVEETMARIKKEAARQTRVPDRDVPAMEPPKNNEVHMETPPPDSSHGSEAQVLTLADFSPLHDSEFIDAAYGKILGRQPDEAGRAFYLDRLSRGEYTKTQILGRLRYSDEGRKRRVRVKGLLLPFLVQLSFGIPLVGRFIRTMVAVVALPNLHQNFKRLEGEIRARQQTVDARITALETALSGLREDVAANEVRLSDIQAYTAPLADISRQVGSQHLAIADMQQSLLVFMDQAREKLDQPFDREDLEVMGKEESHLRDAVYLRFEDRFRGAREEITERVRIYLPEVNAALVATGNRRVVDLGSGRGEWLELLKENNIRATGVDMNRIMAALCRDRGLEVVESDALAYLRGIPADSLAAVTGFHLIEHLPHTIIIALLDAAFRALAPGGVAVFETPNPENILVGAHYFYTDPTHRRPLVPATMAFFMEDRGFDRVEIRRLHKYSDYFPVTEGDSFKDKHMYNEMDYAVLGTKGWADPSSPSRA